MPTLLDTHARAWWVSEDRRLSRPARRVIEKSVSGNDLWLSLISIWEVAKKVEKGQLVLDRPLDESPTAPTSRWSASTRWRVSRG